ncbi:MAG: hypothetical protein AB7R69_04300 [Candidatus Babeliales bacterium]
MKKDTVLGFIALILFVFALRSLAEEVDGQSYESCPGGKCTYQYGRKTRQVQNKPTVNCRECCKQGRFASRECVEQCGSCQLYNDEGKAEAWDFPSN